MEYNGNFFKLMDKTILSINLNGYWQSLNISTTVATILKQRIIFVKDIMTKACTQLPEGVLVSVHAERADYLNIPDVSHKSSGN